MTMPKANKCDGALLGSGLPKTLSSNPKTRGAELGEQRERLCLFQLWLSSVLGKRMSRKRRVSSGTWGEEQQSQPGLSQQLPALRSGGAAAANYHGWALQ